MNVKFTGKIIAAGQVQMGTSQNGTQWSSCEYTIEELNEQYPARAVMSVYGSDKLQQFNIQLGGGQQESYLPFQALIYKVWKCI